MAVFPTCSWEQIKVSKANTRNTIVMKDPCYYTLQNQQDCVGSETRTEYDLSQFTCLIYLSYSTPESNHASAYLQIFGARSAFTWRPVVCMCSATVSCRPVRWFQYFCPADCPRWKPPQNGRTYIPESEWCKSRGQHCLWCYHRCSSHNCKAQRVQFFASPADTG